MAKRWIGHQMCVREARNYVVGEKEEREGDWGEDMGEKMGVVELFGMMLYP